MISLQLVEAPAEEPVTVEKVKGNSKVEHEFEDSLIDDWITSARLDTEEATQRALITQTWELVLARFPTGRSAIKLRRPPVQSIASVTYVDEDGDEQTLDEADYILVKGAPAELYPAPGERWPAVQTEHPAAVTVRFVAGYGDEPTDVPANLRDAIVLRATTRNVHREDMVTGTIVSRIDASKALERHYVWSPNAA